MNINNFETTSINDQTAGDDITTANATSLHAPVIAQETPTATTTAGVEAELLDLPQTAKMLNYSVKTIRDLDINGKLPRPIRVCRHLRFSRTELKHWILNGTPPRQKWEVIWQRIRDKV